MKIKAWIARDKRGNLDLFIGGPAEILRNTIGGPFDFPEVTFENNLKQVTLTIEVKDENQTSS